MTHPTQTYDAGRINRIRRFSHVMVIRNNHQRRGQTGTVVRIDRSRVWIVFPDGNVVPAGHQSVRVMRTGGS